MEDKDHIGMLLGYKKQTRTVGSCE